MQFFTVICKVFSTETVEFYTCRMQGVTIVFADLFCIYPVLFTAYIHDRASLFLFTVSTPSTPTPNFFNLINSKILAMLIKLLWIYLINWNPKQKRSKNTYIFFTCLRHHMNSDNTSVFFTCESHGKLCVCNFCWTSQIAVWIPVCQSNVTF